ncbi:hypothetical protein [Streptomyces vinaceus]|uniref:hypothetical protein n=1 Tax=Streptomyces vinaceus TaxID=1960 RepID=UPI0035DAFFA0
MNGSFWEGDSKSYDTESAAAAGQAAARPASSRALVETMRRRAGQQADGSGGARGMRLFLAGEVTKVPADDRPERDIETDKAFAGDRRAQW